MPTVDPVPAADVDFIEELRLRCWARENYCYPEVRQTAWHPVVHDEMRRRDADIGTSAQTSVLAEDEPPPSPSDSTILTDVPAATEGTGKPLVAHPAAVGPIVPLAPDLEGLHGPHEINPPHTRISEAARPEEMHYT